MFGPDTRASKSRCTNIDTIGSYPNGKHLLGPSLGSEEEHDKESYDPEEEAELINGEVENQNKMDAPELIEMEREDEDVVKGVIDYAAGLMSAASRWWSSASGSAEERQFGDSGNNEIMACEERRSMTNRIDTYGEFDLRSVQTIAAKEVASQNKPTPPVLPKLFRLDGQTGRLQAEQADQAEEFEKELEFEYLPFARGEGDEKLHVHDVGDAREADRGDRHRQHLHPGVPARRTTCPSSHQSKRDTILVRHPCT